MSKRTPRDEPRQQLPLPEAMANLIEECRMLLPGIQALFGFQLIAVFNSTFDQKLSPLEQKIHLLAIGFVGIAIALIMTPAAYHRQTEPHGISWRFIDISTRLLLWSMAVLGLSICLDLYLISHLILRNTLSSLAIAIGLAVLFVVFWFMVPRSRLLKSALDPRD